METLAPLTKRMRHLQNLGRRYIEIFGPIGISDWFFSALGPPFGVTTVHLKSCKLVTFRNASRTGYFFLIFLSISLSLLFVYFTFSTLCLFLFPYSSSLFYFSTFSVFVLLFVFCLFIPFSLFCHFVASMQLRTFPA